MRRKLLSILLCVGLLLSLLAGFTFAEGTPVFEISGTGIASVDGTYTSVLDAIKAYYKSIDAQSASCTMTLLADTTMEISTENSPIEGLPVGIYISGDGSVLDLGGHTLTVTGSGVSFEGFDLPAMAINTSSTSSPICVKNGTVVLNGNNMVGIVNGNNYLNVENVTILPGEDADHVTGVQNGMNLYGQQAGTIVKNCQIILGENNTDVAGQTYTDPGNDKFLQIQSGQFSKNPVDEGNTAIQAAENTSALATNPDGVTGTVFTSNDTTAMIVKDGRAYTYDSLQDAVDAAAKQDEEVKILLLKHPDETTIPDGTANITLDKLNEDVEVAIGDIVLKDTAGNTFNPKDDGTVAIPQQPEQPEQPSRPPVILPPVISPVIPTMPGLPFKDVSGDAWYYDAVDYVYDHDLMDGVGGGRFNPLGKTTRGMIVTILYRMEGSPRVYSDRANWWSDARAWAMEYGVSDGTNMTANITREQLAAMLFRYAKLTGADVSARSSLSRFADSGAVSGWAKDAMQWAVAEGIVNGKGSTLDPKGLATRAEVAAMFMRFDKSFG